MVDLFEGIYSRRSIRNYKAEPVPEGMIKRLLEAAIMAPSASNGQPWAFAVIQGFEAIKECNEKCKVKFLESLGDDPLGYRNTFSNPDHNIFFNASTLIIVYSKQSGSGSPPELMRYGDCCLAAQNIMLAAHAMGLGSCWIGMAVPYLSSEESKSELGVSLNYIPVAPLIIGYPEPSATGYIRNPVEILFWNK